MWSFGTTTAISAIAALLFSMGNVSETAMAAGVPYLISMAISPTVDVVVIGLTIVVQYLVLAGSPARFTRAAKLMLLVSAAAMLIINCLPSVIGAITTEYDGPLMRATETFTPAADQLTATQLWWKACLEAVVPGILVLWSHVGPKIAQAFREIRANADAAALAKVELRTLATEQDRADAAAARAAAEAELAAAEQAAADLRRSVAKELDQQREDVEAELALRRRLAAGDAETVRAQLSADASADRDAAVRELADARRVRASAEASADDARRELEAARREAERILADARASAEQATNRAGHQVSMLNAEADAKLAEARRLATQAAADKAAADAALRESTDNLRTAEQLLAEATADAASVRGQSGGQPRGRTLHPVPVPVSAPPAGPRLSADELLAQRLVAVKEAYPDWATKPPTQAEIGAVIGRSGASSTSPILQHLRDEATKLAGVA